MLSFLSSSHRTACHLFLLAALSRVVLAGQFLDTEAVPAGVSSACLAALTADTACRSSVADLSAGKYYPLSALQVICDESCSSALSSFHASVLSSCAGDVWEDDNGETLPVALFSELIRYSYNLTCLSDGGRFCNNVAAAYAAAADPQASEVPGGLPAGGDFGIHDTTDPCDSCLLANLRFKAESPYYEGPVLQSQSAYESKASSCGIASTTLTTTANSLLTPTSTVPTATPTCAGSVYTIQPSDDCHSISLSQGIGTEWLIIDNSLVAFCHDFPTEGELCLVNTCDVYTVLESDTCKSIVRQHGITDSQLRAWNPSINAGCYNLDQMIGDQICVSKPGTPYVAPSETTIAPSIPTTAAPLPTNAASGSNTYCGTWYEAQLGDYCNLIVMKYGISLVDFVFLNSAINENCTNLYAEESYCVRPVGDINTYSGKPGYAAPTLTMTGTIEDSATTLPDASFTYPSPVRTPFPLATGSRKDCSQYSNGDEWQQNLTSTYFTSHCALMAAVIGVTLEDLQVWNPSLGNVSDDACSFETGVRYCAKYYDGEKTGTSTDEDSAFPAREGMTTNCSITADVRNDGYPTCSDILAQWELTIADFYAMNPSVGSDCSGMWAGYHYCVRTNDWVAPTATAVTSTTSTSEPTSSPTAPGPVQDGQPAECNKWHLVESGDTCSVITSTYSITFEQFREWNPAVSEDCVSGFWGGYAYCVGVSSSSSSPAVTVTPATTSTVASAPATTTTAGPVAAPDPNQAGNAIASCSAYAQAQSGDWCTAFADRNGVTYANLYAWNSVLGSNGENCGGSFWSGYWYCVAVVA
ncbi:hypothetical protein PFICI_13296 [Pestalotiopsis fici W106-1]|uniref:LysM domain-containing protein n=1 Tax=Pestalotiopsis fici (strain W106-1 / CGMCC3.15140) TaxID=1229662 RepID=W3WNW5_PESFW|nr:uncharacterized protein PFICI_13296 [Pestalotiopsis fici W106-1]ETS74812.1 hypothetical protein PFICI_13296 [Pestalotiopsis fici W106-1]